jgi:hypothetical protein
VKSQQPALSRHEWYALVMLDPDKPTAAPRTFIVPRDHVAAAAWIGHMNWLTDPSAPPGRRNAGLDQARVGIETVQRYEDCWNLLGTPTDKVRVMLPEWYRELAAGPRVGLPEGHPWKKKLPEWKLWQQAPVARLMQVEREGAGLARWFIEAHCAALPHCS